MNGVRGVAIIVIVSLHARARRGARGGAGARWAPCWRLLVACYPALQAGTTKSWGIAYGLDQATEWKSVAKAAGFALAVLLILEYVHIIPASRWMEDHLDTLSVHATLFTGRRTTWWLRIRTHLRFHSRVTT